MPQSLVCVHFYSSSSWFTETKTEDSMQYEHLMWSNGYEECAGWKKTKTKKQLDKTTTNVPEE